MVAILMIPANLTTLNFLNVKVLLNKGYEVIISVHDVIHQILLCDSN